MLGKKERNKAIFKFMFTLFMVCFALFITFYARNVERYNTTILSFNYSYGFISRGLLGTLYLWLNDVLPIDILNFEGVVNVTFIATTIIVAVLFLLALVIVRKCDDLYLTNVEYVILFFAMFFVSMWYSTRNMGRPDVYMMFLTFIGLFLIIYEKFEWLLIPLAILNCMIHQGYVFMFYNIFMYLLAYKVLNTTGKQRKKYVLILGISFICVSVLFLYFNFFSHVGGPEIYDDIVALATMLGDEGEYFDILINHEILGIDPWKEELPSHIYNFVEFFCFSILNLPYLVLGVRLFKNILHAAPTKLEKIKYALIPICALTIMPMYLIKIDFGRWVFAGTAYFSLVILALIALKDKIITEELHALMEDIKARYAYAHLLLIYIVTMIPLYDIHINQITRVITDWLDNTFFHIL